MSTIQEIFNLSTPDKGHSPNYLVDGTCLGIEHELEDMPDDRRKTVEGWKMESDGSLRNNGIEYVFNGPKGGAEAEKAIIAMHEMLLKTKHDINERTSTHVHIDFRDFDIRDVGRFAALYSLIEPVLFKLCDESRTDNPFCVPVADSYHLKAAIKKMMDGKGHFGNCRDQGYRYGAINFASLPRYGTVEVRMRETVTDPSELFFWCNIFLSLKLYVRETSFKPLDIATRMEETGAVNTLNFILGEQIVEEICSRVPNIEELVSKAISTMKPALYSWEGGARSLKTAPLVEESLFLQFATKTGNTRLRDYILRNQVVQTTPSIGDELRAVEQEYSIRTRTSPPEVPPSQYAQLISELDQVPPLSTRFIS